MIQAVWQAITVSTHSRLKAAGSSRSNHPPFTVGFNTQPPEGGWGAADWLVEYVPVSTHSRLKAAGDCKLFISLVLVVSTHSRLKAAGPNSNQSDYPRYRFNTQPPEGGWLIISAMIPSRRRFNTQPPEGGWSSCTAFILAVARFNTQPPEGGWLVICVTATTIRLFQHTAA